MRFFKSSHHARQVWKAKAFAFRFAKNSIYHKVRRKGQKRLFLQSAYNSRVVVFIENGNTNAEHVAFRANMSEATAQRHLRVRRGSKGEPLG